jgi:hypothetical protein
MESYLIEHHHNSRRFRCPCGIVHEWTSPSDGPLFNPTWSADGRYYSFVCNCFRIHVKLALNFRGEGPTNKVNSRTHSVHPLH